MLNGFEFPCQMPQIKGRTQLNRSQSYYVFEQSVVELIVCDRLGCGLAAADMNRH